MQHIASLCGFAAGDGRSGPRRSGRRTVEVRATYSRAAPRRGRPDAALGWRSPPPGGDPTRADLLGGASPQLRHPTARIAAVRNRSPGAVQHLHRACRPGRWPPRSPGGGRPRPAALPARRCGPRRGAQQGRGLVAPVLLLDALGQLAMPRHQLLQQAAVAPAAVAAWAASARRTGPASRRRSGRSGPPPQALGEAPGRQGVGHHRRQPGQIQRRHQPDLVAAAGLQRHRPGPAPASAATSPPAASCWPPASPARWAPRRPATPSPRRSQRTAPAPIGPPIGVGAAFRAARRRVDPRPVDAGVREPQ